MKKKECLKINSFFYFYFIKYFFVSLKLAGFTFDVAKELV